MQKYQFCPGVASVAKATEPTAQFEAVIALVVPVFGINAAALAKDYDLIMPSFDKDCTFDAQSLANLRKTLVEQKLLSETADMSTLYTEAFLPKR